MKAKLFEKKNHLIINISDGLAGEHVEFQSMSSMRPSDKLFDRKFRYILLEYRIVVFPNF